MRLLAQRHGMPVHVPFHVGQTGLVDDPSHIVNDVIPNFRLGQIQKKLMPSENRGKVIPEDPVRMCPVEIRVHVDAFRFEPKAKLHSQIPDFPGQTAKALRKLLQIHRVVTQTGLIIVTLAEPAVIQHEQFASQFFCRLRQVQKSPLVKLEETGLPVIVQHRTFPVLPVFGNNVFVDEFVHPTGQFSKTFAGPGHYTFRCVKFFAGRKGHGEVGRRDALHDTGHLLQRALCGGIVIAGVNEVEAVHSTPVLVCTRLRKQEAGIMTVGRGSGDTLIHHPAVQNRKGVFAHFCDPTAVKGGHFVATRQIHHPTHQFSDDHITGSGIFDPAPASQCGFEEGKPMGQPQSGLFHHDLQGFAVSSCLRHDIQGSDSGQNPMAHILEFRGLCDFQRAFPVVTPAAATPGKTHGIHAGAGIPIVQQHRRTPAQSLTKPQCFCILNVNGRAKMKLFQQSESVYSQ